MTKVITISILAALAGSVLVTDAADAQQPRPVRARPAPVAQEAFAPVRLVAVPPQFDPSVASLPRVCPEGRTRSGECVNPILAQIARRTAIVATQARLSKSGGPPAMPIYDPYYRYPNALFADIKRDLDLEYGRRPSSYIPLSSRTTHVHSGAGTPFPYAYPVSVPSGSHTVTTTIVPLTTTLPTTTTLPH
jgi:hypothetical protein